MTSKKTDHTCPNCGKHFVGTRHQVFCSTACHGQHKTKVGTSIATCGRCGKEFRFVNSRTNVGVKYCSTECYRPSPDEPYVDATNPDIGYIPLSGDSGKGKVAIVDSADVRNLPGRWRYHNGYALNDTGSMHRTIAGQDGFEVDHINGNRLDNRRSNLRQSGRDGNTANRVVRNKTGYRGVSVGKGNRFMAIVTVNRRAQYLGTFDTAEEAARVRDAKALELYGEFAWLNFPPDGWVQNQKSRK